MNEPRVLRPMEYGDIFNEAFDLYKRNFLLLAGIGAVVYIPYGIATAFVLDSQFAQGFLGLGFALPLVAGYGAIVKALSDRYLGEPASIGESWRYALRRMLPMLLTWLIVGLLVVLIIVALAVLFPLIAASGGGTAGAAAMGLVLVLLALALTILAAFWLAFLPSVMIVEDRFYLGALKRSRELSKGNWWRIFVVGFCTLIVTYGVIFVLLILVGVVIGIRSVASGGMASPDEPGMRSVLIGTQIVSGVMQAIFTPLTALPFVLLYFDVRVRREGYDVELLAREMGSLPPEMPPPATPA